MNESLIVGFLRNVEAHPDQVAVEVEGSARTYGALASTASSWAAQLDAVDLGNGRLTGVLGARSLTTVTGVVAALLRGHGYVPFSPSFPAERLVDMLERSGCSSLVVDSEGLHVLPGVLAHVRRPLTLLVPGGGIDELIALFPQHTWIVEPEPATYRPRAAAATDLAYLLFTSGSTGRPKGVMVTHANVRRFVEVMVDRYGLGSADRFSQTFELVFDLSVFDHFCAWEVGAAVVIPSKAELRMPARYLVEQRITIWFSVPSLGQLMRRLRMLAADTYPDLRWVLFCGEALPANVAAAFAEAAPNAIVENLYGPTEVTLACTLYRWDPDLSPAECLNGCVPIGSAFPGMNARVVDEEGNQVAVGESGELVMQGPQVCPGYWHDEAKTSAAFVRLPGTEGIHYRTGDRVMQQAPGQPLKYLGRVDFQVKINGFRVELGEVEAVFEELCGVRSVVVAYELRGAAALAAFVLAPVEGFEGRLAGRLPDYMIPVGCVVLDAFPLNTNGKIDRPLLATMVPKFKRKPTR